MKAKLIIRDRILITICLIISIPGFILYEIFNNTSYHWREVKVISIFLKIYYAVISRIIKIMVKNIDYI